MLVTHIAEMQLGVKAIILCKVVGAIQDSLSLISGMDPVLHLTSHK